jgi:hypothetical protein
LPTMGSEAAPKPYSPVSAITPRMPVYCRFAADREQATLLRPPARIKSFADRPHSNRYGLRPESKTSRASLATNGIGWSVKSPLLPAGRRSPARRRWGAKRPQSHTHRFLLLHRVCRFYCRFATDREQATLLRPPARIKSFAGKPPTGIGWSVRSLLLPGGRRSPACRRWGAQRPYTSNWRCRDWLPSVGGSLLAKGPFNPPHIWAPSRESRASSLPQLVFAARRGISYGLRPESKPLRIGLIPTDTASGQNQNLCR